MTDTDTSRGFSALGDDAYEVHDLRAFLDHLQDALAPAFAEERDAWEREGIAAMARAAALGVTIDTIGGNCPVQAEGGFDGTRFYFRARGDEWQLRVGPEQVRFTDAEWVTGGEYGDGPYAAGWMYRHEAVALICDAIEAYRSREVVGHDHV